MPMRGEAISVQPPELILGLVARFDRNRDSYLSGGINEMQLRQEFINPFFSCLGWEIEMDEVDDTDTMDELNRDSCRTEGSAGE